MAIFLITPLGGNFEQISTSVRENISSDDRFELQNHAGWLVSFKGTSVEISNLLGVTSADPEIKPTVGSAMVTTVGSYYGRGSTTMWEWLKIRFENQ